MELEIQPTLPMEPMLTVPQVAQILAVSDTTVYRLTDKKELASVRFFGTIRVKQSALERFIREHTQES